jgi:hypothetical protein
VPSISLATAIGLLGDSLPIAVLKIDAQGVDLALVRATPSELIQRRVRTIQMELRSPTCPLLYAGQMTCDAAESYMKGIGFHVEKGKSACPVGLNADGLCFIGKKQMNRFYCCERNIVFVNDHPVVASAAQTTAAEVAFGALA